MDNFLKNYKLEGESLAILAYPHRALTSPTSLVTEFNAELAELCKNMLYTMYNAPGIGLAAPQIGISKKLFVLDVDFEREIIELPDDKQRIELSDFNPQIFINPVIETVGSDKFINQEGCLSLPGIFEDVERYEKIKINYQDLNGKHHSLEADDMLAICIQHENDHLNGLVFIDRLSQLKKLFYKKKLSKK